MRPVTSRFLASLHRPFQPVVDVRASRDGGASWQPLELQTGSVTADRTSQTRWACDLTLSPATPVDTRGGLTPFGTRVRVRWGLAASRREPVWIPLGVYRVDEVSRDRGSAVKVTGSSLESQVQDSRLLVPTTFAGEEGDTARALVETLVRDAVPDAVFEWRVDGSQRIPRVHQDTDRWALIDGDNDAASIAKTLGAEIYCDGAGVWVVAPTPTLYDDPVWQVRAGEALVSATVAWSRENVYNVVVANGENTDEDEPPVGPGIAWDNDPRSPTYAGTDPLNAPETAGPFGIIPRFYTSGLFTNLSQCNAAAGSLLADALGLHKTVGFSSVVNTALEPGDVVGVDIDLDTVENHLVDAFTIDLTKPTMSCTTRATTTRMLGLGDLAAAGETGDISIPAEQESA